MMDLLPLLQDLRFRLYADDGETPVDVAYEPGSDDDGHRYRYVDAPGHDFVLAPLLNDDHTAALDYWIAQLEAGTHMPRRDDPVVTWLKEHAATLFPHRFMTTGGVGYDLLEDLIDAYNLHADTGTPLGEHACEGPGCERTHTEPLPLDDVLIIDDVDSELTGQEARERNATMLEAIRAAKLREAPNA